MRYLLFLLHHPLHPGRARSIDIPRLSSMASDLAEKGAKEICLVGQALTIYGRDLYGEPRLRELLSELEQGASPGRVDPPALPAPLKNRRAFIDFVAGHERILSYLDIPVQHVDPVVLKTDEPALR